MTARGTLGAGVTPPDMQAFQSRGWHWLEQAEQDEKDSAWATRAALAEEVSEAASSHEPTAAPEASALRVCSLVRSPFAGSNHLPAPMTNSGPIFRVSPSMSTTLRINSILHSLSIRPTQDLNLIRLTWSMATATVKLRYLIPSTVLNITRLTPGRSRVHTQYKLAMNPRLLPHTTASRTLVSP